MVSNTCPFLTKSPSLKWISWTSPATVVLMEIVEIASTVPTAVTSTGIIFCVTFATVTRVARRAGGAACCFAQPAVSTTNMAEQTAVDAKRDLHLNAFKFLSDQFIFRQPPIGLSH